LHEEIIKNKTEMLSWKGFGFHTEEHLKVLIFIFDNKAIPIVCIFFNNLFLQNVNKSIAAEM